jgi:HEAT repeat protein
MSDLCREAGRDDNSRVRVVALRALGERRDRADLPVFRNAFADDDSYQVQAEALRSIGKCGDGREMRFLEDARRLPSPRNVIRNAAEWAIQEISK